MTQRPHFASLDGLRCLAIVPVVWHHSTPYPLDGVLGRGPLGVDLFFALSGFLITSLLLHERAGGQPISLERFWVRRSLRIFPLYYLVLAAFVLHAIFIRADAPERAYFLRSVPFYATYTSNWFMQSAVGHPIVFAFAWSLAAEEQFYLLWPPVLRWIRGTVTPLLLMLGLVALDQCAESGRLAPVLGEGLALRVVRSFATPIGLGSVLALLVASPAGASIRALLAQRWSSLVAFGLVAMAAIDAWPLFTTHLTMTALVGACALRADHFLAPLLEQRVVRHVGTVSYGIYLLNVPVVSACRRLLGESAGPTTLFACAMLGSIAFATVTYRFVERPFFALRERFRTPDRTPTGILSGHERRHQA